MSRFKVLIWALVSLAVAGCGTTSPSSEGVEAYRQAEWIAAAEELSPLAKRGDALAQFYLAMMSLRGVLQPSLSEEDTRAYLTSSASGGHDGALGLMVWLSADPKERRRWLDVHHVYEAQRRDNPSNQSLVHWESDQSAVDRDLMEVMDEIAGGPIPLSAATEFFPIITPDRERWLLQASMPLNDVDSLVVDQRLARRGNKEAQTRLALRYQSGQGVDKDDDRSITLLHAAGTDTPGQNGCFDQVDVHRSPGSAQCDGQRSTIPGIPRAQWELCQAYAFGRRTEQNEDKAEHWCNRAMADARYRTRARDVLIEMAPPPPSE
ncbi:MAG: hypothetical protein AAFX52_11770 [Pseudomonadota bacterium]